MRVRRYSMLGMREPALDKIVLSQAERQTLVKAAAILDEIRELRNGGDLDADDDLNTDVALAAYSCRDLCSREIPVELGWALL